MWMMLAVVMLPELNSWQVEEAPAAAGSAATKQVESIVAQHVDYEVRASLEAWLDVSFALVCSWLGRRDVVSAGAHMLVHRKRLMATTVRAAAAAAAAAARLSPGTARGVKQCSATPTRMSSRTRMAVTKTRGHRIRTPTLSGHEARWSRVVLATSSSGFGDIIATIERISW